MPVASHGTLASNEVVSDKILHFDYPGSDIILRSCDSHIFRVPRLYMVNSSPVLRELILRRIISNTSDVSNDEEQEPLPVVKLPESGTILHSLLTFVFPIAPNLPSTAENIMGLLSAAQKYQMGSVLSHIRSTIARQNPPFIRPETALLVYFLAQKNQLHLEALQAARVTLRLSMTIEDLGDRLEFPGMAGAYLHELWEYHKRIRNDLRSRVIEFRDSGVLSDFPDDVKGLRCTTPYSHDHSFPRWLGDYIGSIVEAPHLFDPIELKNARARHLKEFVASSYRTCSCVDISSQTIRAFWDALTAVIHGVIEKVRRTGLTRPHLDDEYHLQAESTLALVKEESTSANSHPPYVPLRLNVPDANIIVRSSDQATFRVHRSLLAMSSPFFDRQLSLPRPPNSELVDGLPVVQLSEDAGLLNSLISLLYPIPPIIPSSYDDVLALLAACEKYNMVSIQSNIRAAVTLGTFPAAPVGTEAFRAYAIASSMGLVPEMENATDLTMEYPMTFESLGEGLRSFKGRALCDLVSHRKRLNHLETPSTTVEPTDWEWERIPPKKKQKKKGRPKH